MTRRPRQRRQHEPRQLSPSIARIATVADLHEPWCDFELTEQMEFTDETATAEITQSWPKDSPGEAIVVRNMPSSNTENGPYHWEGPSGSKGRAVYIDAEEQWLIVELGQVPNTTGGGGTGDDCIPFFIAGTAPSTVNVDLVGMKDNICADCEQLDRQYELDQQDVSAGGSPCRYDGTALYSGACADVDDMLLTFGIDSSNLGQATLTITATGSSYVLRVTGLERPTDGQALDITLTYLSGGGGSEQCDASVAIARVRAQ